MIKDKQILNMNFVLWVNIILKKLEVLKLRSILYQFFTYYQMSVIMLLQPFKLFRHLS